MMTHGGMSVHLDNLMGGNSFTFCTFFGNFQGGLVGAVGDDILTMVGEDVLEKHKVAQPFMFGSVKSHLEQGMLKDLVKKSFREKASVFLDVPYSL